MGVIDDVFGVPVAVLPVVHVLSPGQALEQAALCAGCGADGVFLIWHGGCWEDLAGVASQARRVCSWVGVNALDLDPVGVFSALVPAAQVDGIWCDDAGVDERAAAQTSAERVDVARAGFGGLYFGGVAFKYQRHVDDLEAAAMAAVGHMDVLCTSGAGTGSAPTAEHVARLATGVLPVAVASGVSAENAAELVAAGARALLVASSLEVEFGRIDAGRLEKLIGAVRVAG